MRNHAQFAELLVNHHIFHSQQAHGHHNAERHGTHHEHRIDGTHDAHLYIVVNHVVHKVYNGNSRHNEQCARQQRMVRRARKPCKGGDISQTCGHQRRNGDAHIQIDTELYATRTDTETCKSGDRGKQKGNPVAAEQLAEATTGKTRTDGNEIGGVVPLLVFYLLQLFLVAVERIVFLNGTPGQLADFGYGRHVDTMFLALLKFGIRVRFVTQVHHQHCISHVDVKIFLR